MALGPVLQWPLTKNLINRVHINLLLSFISRLQWHRYWQTQNICYTPGSLDLGYQDATELKRGGEGKGAALSCEIFDPKELQQRPSFVLGD